MPAPRLMLLLCTTMCACPAAPSEGKPAKPNPTKQEKAPEPPAKVSKASADNAPAKPAKAGTEVAMAKLTDGPLPLRQLLGKGPAAVEAQLGDPLGKGAARTSCVRFVPKRVWFECQHAAQRYADPDNRYSAVGVVFEDGLAASVAYEGIPGQGSFDPIEALRSVGLELPGEPRVSEPASNVKLYSWFNSASRLLIDDKQYRVEVSSVDSTWESSKVEVILNHPLSEEQKAKIKPVKNQQ